MAPAQTLKEGELDNWFRRPQRGSIIDARASPAEPNEIGLANSRRTICQEAFFSAFECRGKLWRLKAKE